MKLTITAKNLTLNPDVEKYAQRRLSRLDRRLRHSVPARLVIRREDTRRRDERFVAEVTADLKGAILRGEERGASLEAAIDKVTDVLDRQIRRYKTRRKRRGKGLSEFEDRLAGMFNEVESEEESPEVLSDGRVVREKRHPVTRMTVEEAVAQMDLLGHDFYLFLNAETGASNVVYRRHDGDYGLIVPQ
ncbi:MAG: ribosome-associated translation inhibitor RaiA [Chloroflexi bacterium]|nr:ribosome-associated translation inhibitor RaiA [Chloroflexota bacterium]MCH8223420.1 ribosome-associated translation inhibitor RaiA [Chloroflexota bacterium]